ncbi:hypothetical protein FTUN_6353 [Frigoriglobus tundricola]|uniref:Thioester reductase (TE) domain-containing protein n=1 Tax=Frigoriglobus tundricola TaxID=2774151 RepID=A0A6M5YY02_9BACT|nr:hypothetical protein FTUN_6353 [Frigoriglobus tundricola]
MGPRYGILLTGATGLLGRYLLRDLLAAGNRVAVLVRPDRGRCPEERVREVMEFARATAGEPLQEPTVLAGDLRDRGLGMSHVDRDWVARNCARVLNAAASAALHRGADGEPHATNATGSRRLLEHCARMSVHEVHHVSTAFVCGDRPGPILESEGDLGQGHHNDYEHSKHAAELSLRALRELRTTVYRPSVIVGDSRTGHTPAYRGVYRFLELANRLAQPGGEPRRRWLPLRLPFTGTERRNLVTVDWVAQAITRVVGRPALHGRTYHLTATRPTSVRTIIDAAVEELGLTGVELAGRPANLTALERAFVEGIQEHWPHPGSDPAFDCGNTLAALPDLPAPRVDRECLGRLIRFAVRDGWGRARGRAPLRGRSIAATTSSATSRPRARVVPGPRPRRGHPGVRHPRGRRRAVGVSARRRARPRGGPRFGRAVRRRVPNERADAGRDRVGPGVAPGRVLRPAGRDLRQRGPGAGAGRAVRAVRARVPLRRHPGGGGAARRRRRGLIHEPAESVCFRGTGLRACASRHTGSKARATSRKTGQTRRVHVLGGRDRSGPRAVRCAGGRRAGPRVPTGTLPHWPHRPRRHPCAARTH